MNATHYPESMSGPRERKWGAPCSICRAESETQCDSCQENICEECAITCAKCSQDSRYCIQCAIKRGAYEQIGSAWYCENCAPDALEGHIDDCPVWCGEPCACAARFDPDEIADRRAGK